MKKVTLKPLMSIEESDKYEGMLLTEASCVHLFKEDVDIFDKETGKCIAKFRKKKIPPAVQHIAFKSLLPAATATDSRGVAAGKNKDGYAKVLRKRKDGSTSKQNVSSIYVNSGIVGYADRSPRFPYCRLTAFNQHHFQKFVDAYPIIKVVDNLYKKIMPEQYKPQRKLADNTAKDFVIPDTSFTTVTVNKNWQTAVHKDVGDYKDGFGNLVALREGKFLGCHFVVVRWGCGFDLQNGDILLVDVHQWHGNTPMIPVEPKAIRLSLVMYYRENMIKCGTLKEELKKVKNRKLGDKIT